MIDMSSASLEHPGAAAPGPDMPATLRQSVRVLETVFRDIATTRMHGVPLLHPGLRVQAVGFAPQPQEPVAMGVLITPWFMNLLRLPLQSAHEPSLSKKHVAMLGLGEVGTRQIGVHRLSFIGAMESALGAYEMCSLASPMFEFADQAAAEAAAREVLTALRQPMPEPDVVAGRRRFLLGRGAVKVVAS